MRWDINQKHYQLKYDETTEQKRTNQNRTIETNRRENDI